MFRKKKGAVAPFFLFDIWRNGGILSNEKIYY